MAKKKMTGDTEATVRLNRLRGAKGPIAPRVLRETEQPVTLEEMLTAFQKAWDVQTGAAWRQAAANQSSFWAFALSTSLKA